MEAPPTPRDYSDGRPDRVFAEDGAMEAIQTAKQAGKIRYIGFTGHKDPLVHLRMLEVAANSKFRFDAVQMHLNVTDADFRSFEQQVVSLLLKDQIAVLGMKALGDKSIHSNTVAPIECLYYAMNLPVSTVITGIDTMEILEQAMEAARTFTPLRNEARHDAARWHNRRGGNWQIRAVQDFKPIRRHREQSPVARLSGRPVRRAEAQSNWPR